MFIPVDRLVRYVQSKEGNLSLKAAFDCGARDISPDMDYFVQEFWKGMWTAIVKEVSPDSIKDILRSQTASGPDAENKQGP